MKGVILKRLPIDLTDFYLGKLILLSEYVREDGFLRNTSRKNSKILSREEIMNILSFNTLDTFSRFKRRLETSGIVLKNAVNPLFLHHIDFKWNKEIFDIFNEEIQKHLCTLEYLKIKSNFYEVDNTVVFNNFDELKPNISGIYRIYKDNEIIYIGKSICIKNRIKSHIKEKDMDGFDFTIVSSEAEMHLYEIYYILKYKPLLNKDCNTSDSLKLELEELIFSNIIKAGQ